MSHTDRMARTLAVTYENTTGFDYVDRLIVFLFLTVNLTTTIFVLAQELTLAEQTEVAPAFEIMGYVLLFFIAWPIIRFVFGKAAVYASERWGPSDEVTP